MHYRTSREENESLTRVGPGTPMGELLRRYWWPIGFSEHLKSRPTFVRLLCEDLVLYRNAGGKAALIGARCAHRRANLCIGRPNRNGIRCRYHGWLYDEEGRLLEAPGEPAFEELQGRVRMPAYPVEELGGLIFAYLGPTPIPLLPRFHILAAPGERNALIQQFNHCNWLQCVENGIDPAHVAFTHAELWQPMEREPEHIWFEKTPFGCKYRAIRPGRREDEFNLRDHPIFMPGISFSGDAQISYGKDAKPADYPTASARWSVPIDDTNTLNVRVHYRPSGQQKSAVELRKGIGHPLVLEPYGEYRAERAELGYVIPPEAAEQDGTVLDSLGPIADRENETLSYIDIGIAYFRQLLLQQIDVVREGGDPVGVFRSEAENKMLVVAGDYRWMDAEEKARVLENARPLAVD